MNPLFANFSVLLTFLYHTKSYMYTRVENAQYVPTESITYGIYFQCNSVMTSLINS